MEEVDGDVARRAGHLEADAVDLRCHAQAFQRLDFETDETVRGGDAVVDASGHVEEVFALEELLAALVDGLFLNETVGHAGDAVGGGLAQVFAQLVVDAPVTVAEIVIVVGVEVAARLVAEIVVDEADIVCAALVDDFALAVGHVVLPFWGGGHDGQRGADIVERQQVVGGVEGEAALALGEALADTRLCAHALLPPHEVLQSLLYFFNS